MGFFWLLQSTTWSRVLPYGRFAVTLRVSGARVPYPLGPSAVFTFSAFLCVDRAFRRLQRSGLLVHLYYVVCNANFRLRCVCCTDYFWASTSVYVMPFVSSLPSFSIIQSSMGYASFQNALFRL